MCEWWFCAVAFRHKLGATGSDRARLWRFTASSPETLTKGRCLTRPVWSWDWTRLYFSPWVGGRTPPTGYELHTAPSFLEFHFNSSPDGSLIKHTFHMLAVNGWTTNSWALRLIFPFYRLPKCVLFTKRSLDVKSNFFIPCFSKGLFFFRFSSSQKRKLRTSCGKERMEL